MQQYSFKVVMFGADSNVVKFVNNYHPIPCKYITTKNLSCYRTCLTTYIETKLSYVRYSTGVVDGFTVICTGVNPIETTLCTPVSAYHFDAVRKFKQIGSKRYRTKCILTSCHDIHFLFK